MTDYRTLSGADFQREVGDDVDKWADAAMISAEDAGYKVDRESGCALLLDDAHGSGPQGFDPRSDPETGGGISMAKSTAGL